MESRKRPRPVGGSNHSNANGADRSKQRPVCSFCQHSPAAFWVELPHLRKQQKKPFCLLHYYTTSAVRVDSTKVTAVDDQVVEEQLRDGMIQGFFAQAFTELQQDLAAESAKAFQPSSTADPLAVLHDLRGRPKKKPPLPIDRKKAAAAKEGGNDQAGGFFKSVPLPDRLVQTQQQQAQLQAKQEAQWKKSQEPSKKSSIYERRKPSRKSIWNLALDPSKTSVAPPSEKEVSAVTCTCGSNDVIPMGNVTSRNQDLSKGETWGMKDRSDDVVGRYQCQTCGKIWMQED